ncbi:hypothetical protein J6590_032056 [Homalodisca vitripennis]|nr:hypothetical protein J6590_032056 [Homalodisca vitripennis]
MLERGDRAPPPSEHATYACYLLFCYCMAAVFTQWLLPNTEIVEAIFRARYRRLYLVRKLVSVTAGSRSGSDSIILSYLPLYARWEGTAVSNKGLRFPRRQYLRGCQRQRLN